MNCGRLYRRNSSFNGSFIVKGDYLEKQKSHDKVIKLVKNVPNKKLELYEEFEDIYNQMNETLDKDGFMGIKEDYEFFDLNKNLFQGFRTGKLLLMNLEDKNIHQIFFDDNISNNDRCCVDVWDISKKRRVKIEDCYNKYLVEVDTLEAVLDDDYFIKSFGECVNNVRNESQISEQTQTTFQSYENSSFLKEKVFPTLLPAIELLDKNKPEDPLLYLTNYLLEKRSELEKQNQKKDE